MWKLTNSYMRTVYGCKWELNKWNKISNARLLYKEQMRLCTGRWFHFYQYKSTAVLLYPIHCPDYTRLFRGEYSGQSLVEYDKMGATEVILRSEHEFTPLSTSQILLIADALRQISGGVASYNGLSINDNSWINREYKEIKKQPNKHVLANYAMKFLQYKWFDSSSLEAIYNEIVQ